MGSVPPGPLFPYPSMCCRASGVPGTVLAAVNAQRPSRTCPYVVHTLTGKHIRDPLPKAGCNKCDKESVGRAVLRFRRGGENPATGLDDRGDFGAGLGSDFRMERVSAGRKGQDCTRQDGGDPAQAPGQEFSRHVSGTVWLGWNLSISNRR